jgi:hypothetical protein
MINSDSTFSLNNTKNEEKTPSLGLYLNKNELISQNLKEKSKSFAVICKTILSNVVFVSAVILSSSFGAYVFQILEQHAELAQCEGITTKKSIKILKNNKFQSIICLN